MPDSKICKDCGTEKPSDDFYANQKGSLYPRCKPCHYARTRIWRAANTDRLRELERIRYRAGGREKKLARKRMEKYGITQVEYEQMLEDQNNVCSICLKPFSDSGRSGDWFIPAVDHDHVTGRVRGILHRRCNLAIEFLLTDEELERARDYLAA